MINKLTFPTARLPMQMNNTLLMLINQTLVQLILLSLPSIVVYPWELKSLVGILHYFPVLLILKDHVVIELIIAVQFELR